MATSSPKQIPIKEGMMRLPSSAGEKACLIGSKCRSCGETFFVKRERCENCQSQDLADITLSTRGKLYAFSVMYYPAPPPYKPPDPFVPYGLGWIELPEGITIYSLLTENDPSRLKVGMEMELVIEKFEEDEQGNDVMVYKFRPV